jgi:DNA-binding transcriptional LysR family regulator
MEIRWLQDFLAVAEAGNFTRAAESRNTSQAAFSRRIQQLEAWVGAALIDRSCFPTRLTPEGERFRVAASDILGAVLDARVDAAADHAGRPDHIRIALPFAVATSRFPEWWARWTGQRQSTQNRMECALITGNVHDLGLGLLSGAVDLMFSFNSPLQPVRLEPERVEAIDVETDFLRPYASPQFLRHTKVELGAQCEAPLLMYSGGVYLARLVDLVVERAGGLPNAPVAMTSDMSDILRELAVAGRGVAWLPESTALRAGADALTPLGGALWSAPVTLTAYRDRANSNPATARVWGMLRRKRTSANIAASQRLSRTTRSTDSLKRGADKGA